MAGTQTLDYPDTTDPLAHATVQRRLWSAYLRAGYNRSTFADALGVRMQTIWQWDTEKSVPTLQLFQRAAELVGFSLDQLAYGHARPERRTTEPGLSQSAITSLLDELGASDAQRAALGEHVTSPAGMYKKLTRTYVATFIASYAEAVTRGQQPTAAIATAVADATNARASADAIALGARPLSPERIEAIGAGIVAARKRKRKR